MRDHRDPPVDGASRPTKLAGRRPKVSFGKKSQKASMRSLSSEMSSSEDASKELVGICSLSEALEANPDGEITEITDDILPESSTSNNSEIASLGVDDPESLLVTAQKQVLESLEANCQSKELADKLINNNTDILSHLSKQRAQFDGLISHKHLVPLIGLVVGILLAIVFSSGSEDSYRGPLPT